MEPTTVRHVSPHPTDADRQVVSYVDIGIQRSVDGGSSFRDVVGYYGINLKGAGADSWDVVRDPREPNPLWASVHHYFTGWWPNGQPVLDTETKTTVIIRGDDGGESWYLVGCPSGEPNNELPHATGFLNFVDHEAHSGHPDLDYQTITFTGGVEL